MHLLHNRFGSLSPKKSCKCKVTILETKLIFQIPLATEQKIGRKSAGINDVLCTVII